MISIWTVFLVFVVVMLSLDLFVFHRKDESVSLKNALVWSAVWIGLAAVATLMIAYACSALFDSENPIYSPGTIATIFATGYLLEFSLSIDNLFVFLVIFSFFGVPEKYMHRVLFWGILGAVLFRAIFILGGVALVSKFSWIIYFFSAFLIYTAVKLIFSGQNDDTALEKKPIIRLFSKWKRFSRELHGHDFIFVKDGLLVLTPLALVLIIIESSDVLFAVDSVPAILGVLPKEWDESLKMFIAFSSNIFAILGLRSFFFALAGVMKMLRFLRYGLAVVLAFIGVKLGLGEADIWHPGIALSLIVLLGILGLSVALSLIFPDKKKSVADVIKEEPLPAKKTDFEISLKKSDPWIGVDFDGTLAQYTSSKNIEKIGKPVPIMLERVRHWIKHGYTVKIFTARAALGEAGIAPVKKWLKENGLPELEVTNQKDFSMIELWDDRAIQVVQNTGKPFLGLSIIGRPSAPILPDEKASETFYLLKKQTDA
ncbi:MAG: TerC/Alx family metal homeostasis membrane protein [Opitutales bacterium]|nr:TerC/Alx family metal homeostasis membrane protein [Opitutales bacterium]